MPDQPINTQRPTSPKLMFILGLVSAVAIVSLIGFVALLVKRGGSTEGEIAGEKEIPPQKEQEDTPKEINLPAVTDQDHLRGPLNAPVKIVEYADLLCPFCQRHHGTMKQLVNDYGDKLGWAYRHFPLPSLHPTAPKMAQATECAAELGGEDSFWALTDKISEGGVSLETVAETVVQLGLDKDKFQECLDSDKYKDRVDQQSREAVDAGGQGTPFNIIIGPKGEKIPLPGAYPVESFKDVIDSLLSE